MAHGDVTVAFFDFLSENHDYTVFYNTEWPPYGQNPIFYGVFGGPSRPEVHAPEGQNLRKVVFLKKNCKTEENTKIVKIGVCDPRAETETTTWPAGGPLGRLRARVL